MRTSLIQHVDASIAPKLSLYIQNRFDLWDKRPFFVLLYEYRLKEKAIEYIVDGDICTLGSRLLALEKEEHRMICRLIFRSHKNIKRIDANYLSLPIQPCKPQECCLLSLPTTEEEIDCKIKKKHLKIYLRNIRHLESQLGKMRFISLPASDCTDKIWCFYFKQKQRLFGTNYRLSPQQYISKYHVSKIYALFFGQTLVSVLLSCEQTSIVYLENLTYEDDYKPYSVGAIAYWLFLKELVKNGFAQLDLGNGGRIYKTRFGGVSIKSYCHIRWRGFFTNLLHHLWIRLHNS